MMKTSILFAFLICVGLSAQAQNSTAYGKVESLKMDVVLDNSLSDAQSFRKVKTTNEDSFTRLYKFKNARIKKALAFTTAKDRPKLT